MDFQLLTHETELPENVPILFYDKGRDVFELGQCDYALHKTLWIEKYGYATYQDFTHYHILVKPV